MKSLKRPKALFTPLDFCATLKPRSRASRASSIKPMTVAARGVPKYSRALSDMVAQPRAATVMGLMEEAREARLRGFKVAQKSNGVKSAFGRFKDFIVGNF